MNNTLDDIGPYSMKARRSLIILAYIGDSAINETGSLVLTSANEQQTIQWSIIQGILFTDIETMSHIDTLGIFDGCPVPESTGIFRACKVLSSLRFEGATLTECSVDAVHALRQKGGAWITIDGLFGELRQQGIHGNPSVMLVQLGGDKPIPLVLKSPSMSSNLQAEIDDVRSHGSSFEAVLKVTVPRDDPSAIEELRKWAVSTPSGTRAIIVDETGVELNLG